MKTPLKTTVDDSAELERERLHLEIVRSIKAGVQLHHPATKRTGTVERVHRDGTVYMHFGQTRGAYIADCPHPDHAKAIATAEQQEKDDRVYLDRRYIRTALAHKAACTETAHGATGDGAHIVEEIHYNDLELT